MKRSLLLVGALCFSSLLVHAKAPERVDIITTNRGKVYEQCRILQVDPDGVMFSHRHGGAKILFSELPPDMQIKLGYDRNRETEYVKAHTEARRAKQLAMWEFRKEVARLQAHAQAVEAARLQLEAAQAQIAAMMSSGYGYGGYGLTPDLLASWAGLDPAYGYYGHGGHYGHGQHGGWYHGRSRNVLAPSEGIYRVRSWPARHHPHVRSVPFGTPAMGPLSPSMSPRTGNPGSIFPSR